jgi:homogentisate 1,2-dioxygenase
MDEQLSALSGFRNHFASEAIEGALPRQQNAPQHVPFNLYAEQISGTAFTAPRHDNLKTWCYRLRPSVTQGEPSLYQKYPLIEAHSPKTPGQLRFSPFDIPSKQTDFLKGLHPVAVNAKAAIYIYTLNDPMVDNYFYNADGELLFIPETGKITLKTELGVMEVPPGSIAVIPRGIVFQVVSDKARGYLCENQGSPFNLPGLGPIGANGLANPHDFISPHAAFEEKEGELTLISKYQNHLWASHMPHSPLNVVAFKGNYLPYQYDLSLFNTINSVSFDHPDPSIFTVLTSQSAIPGTANIDFVIFPARWMVQEHTFRPPYFHRNIMSEFMGLLQGVYDAKQSGFEQGSFSIHNCFSPHGPDAETYKSAVNQSLAPERYENTLAFMLESENPWDITKAAMKSGKQQSDYHTCWEGLSNQFSRR